jgi:polyisoprenoid-binding protein YceI
MPISAEPKFRKPSSDVLPDLSGRWQVDPHASHARFVAGTLAGLIKTPGRFRELSGDLVVDRTAASGALVIDATSIHTGNRMRDRHLRSRGFFDVERHPQLRFEAHWISSRKPGNAKIGGELIVAETRAPLLLDVALRAPADGVVELACRTEVDRLALGVRGARGMVPRTVHLEVVITLRRAFA